MPLVYSLCRIGPLGGGRSQEDRPTKREMAMASRVPWSKASSVAGASNPGSLSGHERGTDTYVARGCKNQISESFV